MPGKRLPNNAAKHAHGVQDDGPAASPAVPSPMVNVGLALLRLRAKRQLSIRALARLSHVSVNTVNMIENGKSSPSVATLQRLAIALDIPITAFFQAESDCKQVAFIQAGLRRKGEFAHGTLEDLGAGMTVRTIEPFVVTIEPDTSSGAEPIVHAGQEFIFCLDGRIDYTVDEQTYLLQSGDSLLFDAQLPHSWENRQAVPARTLMVLCPAVPGDQPRRHHFKRVRKP